MLAWGGLVTSMFVVIFWAHLEDMRDESDSSSSKLAKQGIREAEWSRCPVTFMSLKATLVFKFCA